MNLLLVTSTMMDVQKAAITLLYWVILLLTLLVIVVLTALYERYKQNAVLRRAVQFVQTEVAALNQTTVPAYRSEDGTIAPEKAADLKLIVLGRVKQALGQVALGVLDKATGQRSVDSVLESLIEQSVGTLKANAPTTRLSFTGSEILPNGDRVTEVLSHTLKQPVTVKVSDGPKE